MSEKCEKIVLDENLYILLYSKSLAIILKHNSYEVAVIDLSFEELEKIYEEVQKEKLRT